jgi:thioredoxin-related protein
MSKRIAAVLGTITTMGFVALGAWLMLRSEPSAAEPAEPAKLEWLTDMQKAQEIAAKEKKDLLINFTGSDWCGWCIKLREEVFSKGEFEKALDNFVLVEMDFPSDESLVPPKTREQNELWQERFGIQGFPTLVLTDSQGRPYGSVGYVPGGPPAFLAELATIQKVRESRDEAFAKSKDAQGLEKARLLASAIEKIPAEYQLPMYRAEVQEIVSLDEQDTAGLKTRFTRVLQQADAEEHLKKLQNEVRLAYSKDGPDAALKLVQEALKTKEAEKNPVLRSSLAQAEVNMLVQFEKTKLAMARLEELTKDKTFTKEEQRSFRERQASLFKEAGQTDDALKAYDALIADAGDSAANELAYLTEKAEVLSEAERPKEALEVYNTVLPKTEKGSNEWLTVQLNRGNLLKEDKQAKAAAGVFDEMLTVEGLVPVQKAMLLVYAAEAFHEAKDEKETAARVEKAAEILKELGKSEEIPPQFLDQLSGRLDAVRKEGKPEEKPAKTEAKQE